MFLARMHLFLLNMENINLYDKYINFNVQGATSPAFPIFFNDFRIYTFE